MLYWLGKTNTAMPVLCGWSRSIPRNNSHNLTFNHIRYHSQLHSDGYSEKWTSWCL